MFSESSPPAQFSVWPQSNPEAIQLSGAQSRPRFGEPDSTFSCSVREAFACACVCVLHFAATCFVSTPKPSHSQMGVAQH